jgi:pSer/pThr/pTyr-binding forkhead associated (FHA) protein
MNIRLLVVQGKPVGKSLHFGPGEYYLGRGQECHVRFNSDWVSRQHCVLRVVLDQASVRDLGSRNGTLVNGQLLGQERILDQGDQVQVGPVVFEVHLDREPRPAPSPSPNPASNTEVIFRSGESDTKLGHPPLDSTVLPPFLPRDDE